MLLRDLHKVSRLDLYEVGAKAANLGELFSIGLNVPKGFIVPTPVTDVFYKNCFEKINDLSKENIIEFDELRALHQKIPIGMEVENILIEFFRQLNLDFVSVRSSATLEDSNKISFAGIFDTLLHISEGGLVGAIKHCLSSIFSKRTSDYLEQNNLTFQDLHMAIIIQEMVEPEISGICFTTNPISNNDNEIYIETAWGLGESIVSGQVTPDSYIYDIKAENIKEKNINSQTVKLTTIDGQLKEVAVDVSSVNKQKLSDNLISQLVNDCIKIQEHYNFPQDIEFAVKDDVIYFLQARPITTL